MIIIRENTTQDLTNALKHGESFVVYRENYKRDLITKSPHQYLNERLARSGLTMKEVHKRSGLDSYFYRIFNGDRNPTRDKLLRVIISMELNADEVQDILRIYGHAPLYPRVYRDAAIMFCINKKMNVMEMNLFLDEIGEKPLE